jgi:hypothetical protein
MSGMPRRNLLTGATSLIAAGMLTGLGGSKKGVSLAQTVAASLDKAVKALFFDVFGTLVGRLSISVMYPTVIPAQVFAGQN